MDNFTKKSLECGSVLGVSRGKNRTVDLYLNSLRAENMAKGTLKQRAWYLNALDEQVPILTATEDDLVAFVGNPNWGPEARKSARSALRGLYAWAHRRGVIDENPAAYLRAIRVPAGRPRPVPEPLVRQVFDNCDNDEQTLIVMLAAYAGLRVSEIAGLRSDAVTGYGLRVTGKGGKTRIIPVHPTVAAPLAAHIRKQSGQWVFPSPVRDGHVGYDYIYKRIKAALPPGFTPHQLRHRFATQAYKGTHDLRAVQELLGHSSPNTTVRYTLIEDDALMAAVTAVA